MSTWSISAEGEAEDAASEEALRADLLEVFAHHTSTGAVTLSSIGFTGQHAAPITTATLAPEDELADPAAGSSSSSSSSPDNTEG